MRKRVLNSSSVGKKRVRASRYTKSAFLAALEGTGGIKATIATRLGCVRETVTELLQRNDWADVRAAFLAERDEVADEAEGCIRDAIMDKSDVKTATQNARWYLSKVRPDKFGDRNTVTVEADKKFLPTQSGDFNVDVSTLNLDLDTKRKILAALEEAQVTGNGGRRAL
ncbi:MAG: hypothetical protein K8R87_08955 [Verrucomicrobia bacterium]|nr:hypothetical protein [Verrucomicrobiota bacterium]